MPLRGRQPVPRPPIDKPEYRRLPRNRFEGLPLAPTIRTQSEEVLQEARRRGYCEWCGMELSTEASHSISKAAGGDDAPWNISSLCHYCHTGGIQNHHNGGEPTTAQLLTVARLREASRRGDGTHERIIGKRLGILRDGTMPEPVMGEPPVSRWVFELRNPDDLDPEPAKVRKFLKALGRQYGLKVRWPDERRC